MHNVPLSLFPFALLLLLLTLTITLSTFIVYAVPMRHIRNPSIIAQRPSDPPLQSLTSLLSAALSLDININPAPDRWTPDNPLQQNDMQSLHEINVKFARRTAAQEKKRMEERRRSQDFFRSLTHKLKTHQKALHAMGTLIEATKPTYPQHVYDDIMRAHGYLPPRAEKAAIDDGVGRSGVGVTPRMEIPDDVKDFYREAIGSVVAGRLNDEDGGRVFRGVNGGDGDISDEGSIEESEQRFWSVVEKYLGISPSPDQVPSMAISGNHVDRGGDVGFYGVAPTVTPKPMYCPLADASGQSPCALAMGGSSGGSTGTVGQNSVQGVGAWRSVRSKDGVPIYDEAPAFQPMT